MNVILPKPAFDGLMNIVYRSLCAAARSYFDCTAVDVPWPGGPPRADASTKEWEDYAARLDDAGDRLDDIGKTNASQQMWGVRRMVFDFLAARDQAQSC